MVKKSKIAKVKKQQAMITRYVPIYQALREAGDYEGLSKLPGGVRPGRSKLHDQTDGCPRDYTRRFDMSRICFHELTYQGLIPGAKRASW